MFISELADLTKELVSHFSEDISVTYMIVIEFVRVEQNPSEIVEEFDVRKRHLKEKRYDVCVC